jgi:hypothetical protein
MENIQHQPKGTPIAPSLSSIAIGVTFGVTNGARGNRLEISPKSAEIKLVHLALAAVTVPVGSAPYL